MILISKKLVKISSDITAESFTTAINNCLIQSLFPKNAKIVSATPFNIGKPNRYEISNFIPESILSTFSKFNEVFSPCLAAYRQDSGTQQELVCLTEEWREGIDKDCVVGTLLMNLSKTFDCIPHNLIIAKMAAYGLNFNYLKLILSYLQGRQQRLFKVIY